MNHPTPHYEQLQSNILQARTIVRGVNAHGCRTNLQHLKLQSFILLTHAVIEQYVEDLCLDVAKEARKSFVQNGTISKALVALIAAYVLEERSKGKGSKKIGSELVRNIDEFSKHAFNKFDDSVRSNHGIKPDNLRSLFVSIGIEPVELDTALVNAMNTFGITRGGIAHKFAIKRENTLSDIEASVNAMVRDLAAFDREASIVLSVSLNE